MSSAIGLLLCNLARLKKYLSTLLFVMLTLLFSSHGIAQNIDEVEPNSTLATAQDITASFSRARTADILHSAFLPSVSITATGDETADYYKIDVTEANSSYIFDIDYGRYHGGSFDSYIYLQNSAGSNYANNNNYTASGGGLGSIAGRGYDAYLKYKFSAAGTYYLKVVTAYRSNVNTGATYTLQVSKESASFVVDADEDGMSDDWESFFSIIDPSADLDADGYSNLDEFTQGSDPSFTDSDNDGLANTDDDDDDNDGVLDINDAFPLSFAAALDADADGHPDLWNSSCNDQCIADSGLPALDQFPLLAGAWSDIDGDGLVDATNPGCTINCDIPAELVDPYPNDFDNDNSSDLVDTDDNDDGLLDADADSNGLIEIDSLEKLNAMRYELSGSGLQLTSNGAVDTSGCPLILYQRTYQRRCSGYELTQDLDFDSNSDGVLDENDLYWNANSSGEGLGWAPVSQFTGIFDGNEFEIKNLYINRPTQNYIGLFGRINNATIRNVSLTGSLAEINGRYYVAGLSGRVESNNYIVNSSVAISVSGYDHVGGLGGYSQSNNIFEENYNTGNITGNSNVGGLVGYLGNASAIQTSFNTGVVTGRNAYTGGLVGYAPSENRIVDSFNSGAVEGYNYVGGLIGRLDSDNRISSSYSTGVVKGDSNVGGLVGYKYSGTTVSQSFWATDSSKQTSSAGTVEATGYVGLPLVTLKCAIIANTTSDNSSCVSADGSAENLNAALTLYSGWESSSVWSFGTSDHLPALTINTMNYRDNDADGSADVFDKWPNNSAASVDIDGDGHPDKWSIGCDDDCIANSGLPAIDQFPQHAGAWLDADFDGRPDAINGDCTIGCDLAGLVIDTDLLDFDNDGSPDLVDTDDDGDGILDIDADSDGLIDIDSLEKLNAMRFELTGLGFKLNSNAIADSSGCPFSLYQGTYQKRCRGYELTQDLDFDSNQNGVIDENDLYWNANSSGEGWLPIGNSSIQFSTIFEGNNFEVRNLYINRPTHDYLGLFGSINNATIQNVSLTGPLAQVRGDDYIAALAGSGVNNNSLLNVSAAISVQGDDYIGGLIGNVNRENVIEGCSNSGKITGDNYIGGLVGHASNSNVIEGSFNRGKVVGNQNVGGLMGRLSSENTMRTSFNTGAVIGQYYVGGLAGYTVSNNIIVDAFSSGSVEGNYYTGGLIGRLDSNNQLSSSYSTGAVKGTSNVGGLVGYKYNSTAVSQSFWAIDSSNQTSSSGRTETTGYVGLPLATLKCAIIANTTSVNSSCVSADGSAENLNAALTLFSGWETSTVWGFGANDQLPALVINTVNYRDNDSDGSVDSLDVWPNNAAASLDADNDGHPDSWSLGCDDQCIANSGLPELDQFPQHAGAWLDADFDGRPDAINNACTVNCDLASLIIDTALADFDNDGLLDVNDTDDNNDGTLDADADSDGLIDIDSLEKLNAMRFQLAGAGLQLDSNSEIDSAGCPFVLYQGTNQQRCIGYELTQSLNFDGNLDGNLDENDLYWNANNDGLGLGWTPVGSSTQASFTAIFEGNGHVVENLFINRSNNGGIGLFGYTNQATIKNVGLTGRLGSISGSSYVGAIAGFANNTNMIGVFNTLPIKASSQAAGLIGNMNSGSLENSFNSGSVSCISSHCGGVFGYTQGGTQGNTTLTNTYSTGRITSSSSSASGLVGYKNGTSVQNSYWAVDSSSQLQSSGQNESASYIGLTSTKMECAVSADTTSDNSACVSADGSEENLAAAMTLYSTWGTDYWDYGTAQQLPALKIGSSVYRDSDGDGFLDADDGMPLRIESSLDGDGDGYPDAWNATCDEQCILASGLQLDRFPNHAGAWQDDDLDGRPDAINGDCSVDCDLADLELDTNPALSDADNDGIADAIDTDDNGDGIVDADANSNGLIDINSLERLNAMRYQLTGVGLQLSEGADVDRSGCPVIFYDGAYEQRCSGYELTQNIDFDSNQDDDITADDLYSNVNSSGVVEGWLPIGNNSLPFSTVFNGNGFEIKNLFINRTNTSNIGLFAFLGDANVSNVTFSGHLGSVKGYQYVGALAGIISDDNVLSNIQNQIEVSGSYMTGGIAGRLRANNSVNLVSNLAKIEGRNNSYTGGLFGYADSNSSIADSYNAGFVKGASYVGGLVGHTDNVELKGAFNTGNISGTSNVGGLIGRLGNGARMSSAFNTGIVTGSSSRVGGLVGYSYYIGAISSSFSTGVVIGSSDTGGLAGYYNGYTHRITNSYWATDASGQASSAREDEADGYVGLTLEALKCAITANTDSANSSCVSADGSAEGLAAALTLYKDWELSTYTNELDVEVPYWIFDGTNQLPGLSFKGTAYRDSDNDQVLDALDGFPLVAIGDSLDTDGDGRPDECDADCTLLGMAADTDDDNDGVSDVLDTLYPLISLAGRTDTDGDGVPDNCGQQCTDLGMAEDIDNDNDGVLDVNDAYPLIAIGALADLDRDGIPNDCDLACIDLGMTADNDDDNDGVSDDLDEYPRTSLGGRADSDGDGIPDDCNIGCTLEGMVADLDNDDDGILDEDDRFPNISIGAFLDTDGDGSPDVCEQACLAVGLHADNDDDNDGILDDKDAYRLISLAGRDDFDGDGIPDNCDAACITAGMLADPDDDNDGIADVDDAFAFNAAASVDADNDGFPDSWNESCKYTCQVQSGLTIDALLADSDNDGVLDVNDQGLAGDNGLPVISSGPEDMYLAVNTDEGDAVLLSAQQVDVLKASLFARDAVDRFSSLTFKAYMNNAELVETNEGELLIPSGLQTIRWVAIDSSGNSSEAHVQKIYVYPTVSFKQSNSIYGEETIAEVVVELSGPAPEYPVMVSIEAISRLSTITQDDLESEFSISNRHIIVIEAGEEATLNTQASLMVPIIDDEVGEREEVLILELKPFANTSDTYSLIKVNADKSLHELKVTYENLAPVVTLSIKQNGLEVSEIIQGGGAVILEALISDGNGADTHSVTWDVNELGLEAQLENMIELDALNLAIGQYRISITAEDDGPSPLSTTLAVDVAVVAVVASPVAPVDDKKSDAGALWWMLIVMMGLAALRQKRALGYRIRN